MVEQLTWPLRDFHEVVSGFYDTRPWGPHRGIDIPCPNGTPVLAAAAGVIVFAGYGGELAGQTVEVDHPSGLRTRYLHLQPGWFRPLAAAVVRAGDVLALSNNTGRTSGPHLHFATWTRDERAARAIQPDPGLTNGWWAVDPLRLLTPKGDDDVIIILKRKDDPAYPGRWELVGASAKRSIPHAGLAAVVAAGVATVDVALTDAQLATIPDLQP